MTDELPNGWRMVRVGDLAQQDEQPVLTGPFGTNMGRDDFVESGCPVLTIGCLTDAGIRLEKAVFVREAKASELERYRLRTGDLLFSRMASVGRAGMVPESLDGALFNYHIMRLRLASDKMLPELFLAYVRGAPAVRKYLEDVNHGATRDGINTSQLVDMPVALPPMHEQRRIVAKLEALQARSRRAREALDAVPPLLEKLRQSILAAAFRGDLTKDWRAKNKNVEPATELLKRIRTERRKKWEESELAKMKAKGKAPTDDKWKSKYKEPEPVDITGLPALPEGWCWASVEELSTKVVDGVHKKPNYVPTGIPFLTVKNLTAGPGISFDDVSFVTQADHEEFIKRTDPERGDLLISKDGTLGVTRLVRTDAVFSIFVSLAVVKPVLRTMGEYLEGAFLSPFFQEKFKATGSGLLHIHLVDLRASALPIAPLEEQPLVAVRASEALARLDQHAGRHDDIVKSLTTLERAMLAKAFRGELVPQDPSEEPAGVAPTGELGLGAASAPKKRTRRQGEKRGAVGET